MDPNRIDIQYTVYTRYAMTSNNRMFLNHVFFIQQYQQTYLTYSGWNRFFGEKPVGAQTVDNLRQ